ncbi:MAG: phytanoyl-CoA hydroxylase [Glaciecola sp.]
MPDLAAEAKAFREQGFVKLSGVLDADELEALQTETRAQIDAGPLREPHGDFRLKQLPDGRDAFFRIQFLADKQMINDSLLQVMGHPRILELSETIIGPDWGLYGSAMVFKGEDGGAAIEAHRDAPLDARHFAPSHVYFNVDVYLDRADASSGALWVMPRSQLTEDVRGMVAAGIEQPGFIEVPMEPGDVLFHDAMLLHGSPPTPPGSPLRRVLYYSFQSYEWMAREGVLPGFEVNRDWIARNLKLVEHAVERRRAARPTERQCSRTLPANWRAEVDEAELELRPIAGHLPWEDASP